MLTQPHSQTAGATRSRRAFRLAQHAETTSTRSSYLRLRHHLDRSTRGATAMRACKTGCGAARPARCRCGSRAASKTSERGAARTGSRHRPQGRADQQSHVGGLAHAGRGGFGGGSGRRADAAPQRREWGPGALRAAGRMYSFRVFGRPLEPAEPALCLSVSWLRTRSASEQDFYDACSTRHRRDGVRTTHSHSHKHRNTSATAPSRGARRRNPSSSRRSGSTSRARSSSRSGPNRTSARMFK